MTDAAAFGKYLLLERVSRGGMAEVYKAKAAGDGGAIFAIKRILPHMAENADFIRMFVDEAKICGRLKHPNVCETHALGQVEGAYFIAMEYVCGKDLRELQVRLRQRKTIASPEMVAYLGREICAGLDHAHRKADADGRPLGIIHRDVSPQNVLVSYEGALKIIDFGIAKAESRTVHTRAGVVKGKLGYMSPEQARAQPLDRRSDLFSVGTVLYELATGQRLFHGDNDLEMLERIRNPVVATPSSVNPGVPAELERIVMRALSRDPETRYQWASEMAADLEAFAAAQPTRIGAADVAAWMRGLFPVELARETAVLAAQRAVTSAVADDHEEGVREETGLYETRIDAVPAGAEAARETSISLDALLDSSMIVSIDPLAAAADPGPAAGNAPWSEPSATPHRGEMVLRGPVPRRAARWDAAAAIGLCAAAAIGFYVQQRRDTRPATGALVIMTSSGAGELVIDGRSRGPIAAGAITLKDVSLGEHELVVRGPGAPYARRVRIVPGDVSVVAVPPPPPAPLETGVLRIELSGHRGEAVQIYVDGALAGGDPAAPIALRADTAHELRVEQRGMTSRTFTVRVAPGETVVREVALVPARVRRPPVALARAVIPAPPPAPKPKGDLDEGAVVADAAAPAGWLVANTQPFARVWIDGVDTGRSTPIPARARIPVRAGTHAITFVANEMRYSFEVTVGPGEEVSLTKRLVDDVP